MPAPDAILCSIGPGERRFALMAGGRAVEFAVARPGDAADGIFLGRVVRVDATVGAAFVDIGLARPGFLPETAGLGEGDAVIVQGLADPHADKGAKLTRAVSLVGRFAAFTPTRPGANVSRRIADAHARGRLAALLKALRQPGEGLVARTAAAAADDDAVRADVAALRALWAEAQGQAEGARPPFCLLAPDPLPRLVADNPGVARILVDDAAAAAELRRRYGGMVERSRGPAFDLHEAEEQLERALSPEAPLACGGRLIVERTAALTVIDVDAGPAEAARANMEAAEETARQARLRNLSGHIVLDVIPGGRGRLARVVEALRAAVALDPTPTQVPGASPLGLVEIVRERRRRSLAETMLDAAAPAPSAETVALAALRAILREARHLAGQPALVAAPEVVAALRRLPAALAETESRLARPLRLLPEEGRPRERYDVVAPTP